MSVGNLKAAKDFHRVVYLPAFGFGLVYQSTTNKLLILAAVLYLMIAAYLDPWIRQIENTIKKSSVRRLEELFDEVSAKLTRNRNIAVVLVLIGYFGSFVLYAFFLTRTAIIILAVFQAIFAFRLFYMMIGIATSIDIIQNVRDDRN
ncbi:hypothetical protein [Halomicrobium katesii]|uniref:hypothetical protein n=1 Tax=Halomicrobium katesii TaxID=437163 RepID=UPI0012BA750D|nr:hypothetical protein [Halomicrobium katesii]